MLIPFEIRPDFILPDNNKFIIDGIELIFKLEDDIMRDGNVGIEGYDTKTDEWLYSGEFTPSTRRVVLNTKFKRS